MRTLRSTLNYEPVPLAFGTSGLRGLVEQITDLEAYINTTGFLHFLLHIPDVSRNDTIYIAGDLRPSTHGEHRSILRAVAAAIRDAELAVEYLGKIPTPALAYFALQQEKPCIMVTGSHIPFDRNGIKFFKSHGEVLKEDESQILKHVKEVRETLYASPAAGSQFGPDGMIRPEFRKELPKENAAGRALYVKRYIDFFPSNSLAGKRILVYEHSAVGREVLAEILTKLGAEAVPVGRSETFVPIDTENIRDEQLRILQELADAHPAGIDAIVSTDGDSDRPLLIGMKNNKVEFLPGDLLGLIAAVYLKADVAAVPVSSNDAIDIEFQNRNCRLLKTRIGSPYVIQAMIDASRAGKRVVGWEANGGFLTGADLDSGDNLLRALPTRDAVLPLLSALISAAEQQCALTEIFSRLPKRYTDSGLIDNFPSEISKRMLSRFQPANGKEMLQKYFPASLGFPGIDWIDYTDGIRIGFSNGDVAHLRPSGNAPQMRIYSNSDSRERAATIVSHGLREPDGILRQIEMDL